MIMKIEEYQINASTNFNHTDNNASTTETVDDKHASDDVEETEEEEEGMDGVSSEGEKAGNETLEVNI